MKRVALWPASSEYVEEARDSALSFHEQMPDIERLLITDKPAMVATVAAEFDRVIIRPRDPDVHWYLTGVEYLRYAMELSYGSAVVAFDTDVYFCKPIYDFYELLERFDFVGIHAPRRHPLPTWTPVPDALATINVGVLGFRNNARIRAFLSIWLGLMHEHLENWEEIGCAFYTDQVPLREAIWRHGELIRIWVAPPEYNCRFNFGAYADTPVKVLHGRYDQYPPVSVSRSINSHEGPRVWNTKIGLVPTGM